MKHWLALAALICFGSTASLAQTQTYDVQCDSVTTYSVLIGSATQTNITALFSASLTGTTTTFATVLPTRKWLEIQNIDSSLDALCGVDVITSTTPANWLNYVPKALVSTTKGRFVPHAGGTWRFGLYPFNEQGYPLVPICMNTGTTTSSVTVTQCGSN